MALLRQRALLEHDPGGAWVAEEDGVILGVALALRRPGDQPDAPGYWGLSLLVVRPERQARGIGRALIDAALTYARPGDARIILSSIDPRALRRYAAAGFALHPTVRAIGRVDVAGLPDHDGVRLGSHDDVAFADGIDRAVRGWARGPDHDTVLRMGWHLLVLPERGYAWVRDRRPMTLAARDEDAAGRLLAASLAGVAPDATDEGTEVLWMRSGQDWAVRTCLAAGLRLQPYGPVFTSELTLPSTYLPNGAYL
jgi:GNAT superfamily N-acetyltransferase